jgi:pimeloyl-ACP methyl ester carboxylesterase
MKTELISIATPTTPLDGLWYQPDHQAPKGAVLLFHGNTMNFYTGALRFLPPLLTDMGFACLAFNRRGHDILAIRNSRATEGAAHQTIAESIEDNELAAQWVGLKGFTHPLVIGHSNGGMLAVVHVANHPQTPALALLSAHGGGKDILKNMSIGGLLAQDRLVEFSSLAREMVKDGRGEELMLCPGWWYVITAKTFVNWIDDVPDILEIAPNIKCPVLYIRGDLERAESYPAEEFKKRSYGPTTIKILTECDHFYNHREEAVIESVRDWLKQVHH